MSDDLVKRLLHLDMHPESAPRQAADRIEELEAEREALREALELYVGGCDWQSPPPFCDRPDHMCCKTARSALNREKDDD